MRESSEVIHEIVGDVLWLPWQALDEREQVGDGGHREVFFKAFGHQGFTVRGDGFDVAAEDDILLCFSTTQGDRCGGLGGEQAVHDFAIFGFDDVDGEVRLGFPIGIENRDEQVGGRFVADRLQVLTNRVTNSSNLMADGALLLEDHLSASGIPGHAEHRLIVGDDFRSIGVDVSGEQLLRSVASFGIGMIHEQVFLVPFDVPPLDGSRLYGIEERADSAARSK